MIGTELALRVVTYLLVATGIAALVLGGLLGPEGAALVAGAVLAGFWLEQARRRRRVRPAVAVGLLAVAAVAVAVDLLYLAASVLDGMVHLLLALILARLLTCRTVRDLRDVGFLSFFLLVATSTVTFSLGFLALFVAFLLLGTWLLLPPSTTSATASPSGPACPRRGRCAASTRKPRPRATRTPRRRARRSRPIASTSTRRRATARSIR